ncbi:MAG TPA: hypothetical protein VH333_13660 [Pseudonocardiaceae bacterium]|nr:hypothetical protein [Pseudonocardiaceae bacterium]
MAHNRDDDAPGFGGFWYFVAARLGSGRLASRSFRYAVLAGFVIMADLIGIGSYSQAKLRRRGYGGKQSRRNPVPPAIDPAIGTVLADRERRAKCRDIVAEDPLMAHELHIGRPDIKSRGYNDGGLVDCNAAPAGAIAKACEPPTSVAEAVVAARPFGTVDDVRTMVDVPVSAWPVVRDRGIVISLDG